MGVWDCTWWIVTMCHMLHSLDVGLAPAASGPTTPIKLIPVYLQRPFPSPVLPIKAIILAILVFRDPGGCLEGWALICNFRLINSLFLPCKEVCWHLGLERTFGRLWVSTFGDTICSEFSTYLLPVLDGQLMFLLNFSLFSVNFSFCKLHSSANSFLDFFSASLTSFSSSALSAASTRMQKSSSTPCLQC